MPRCRGLTLRFATVSDRLLVGKDDVARGAGMTLRRDSAVKVMKRVSDNLLVRRLLLSVLEAADGIDLADYLHSDELESLSPRRHLSALFINIACIWQ